MAEVSRFWNGNPGIGDGAVAPYDADVEFAEVMTGVAGLSADPNKGGVLGTPQGALTVTGAAGSITVSPGEALVYGTWYRNDAPVNFAIAAPATAARTDYVVVRKDWATQTCRLAVKTGVEGGAAPTLTRTVGVIWEIPVASISVAVGGGITITGANVRADLWYRTSATTIKTDSNAYVGAAVPVQEWYAGSQILQVGYATLESQYGHGGRPYTLYSNSYRERTPTGVERAINDGYGTRFTSSTGEFQWHTAPSVAADAPQAFAMHMRLAPDGAFYVTPAPAPTGYSGINVTENGGRAYLLSVSVAPGKTALNVDAWTGSTMNGRFSLAPGYAGGDVHHVSENGANRFYAGGGSAVVPSSDATFFCGTGSLRFLYMYVVNPVVVGSHIDLKENLSLLDPAACVQAVLDTDWISYTSKNPTTLPVNPNHDDPFILDQEETPEGRSNRVAQREAQAQTNAVAYTQALADADPQRHRKGFVMGSPDFRVSEMFGYSDRKTTSAESDLGVIACALQQALRDIAELKTQINPASGGTQSSRRGSK